MMNEKNTHLARVKVDGTTYDVAVGDIELPEGYRMLAPGETEKDLERAREQAQARIRGDMQHLF